MARFRKHRGDSIVMSIAVKDNTGAALNCTGGTLRATLKRAFADLDAGALSQVSTPASGIVWTNQATGLATATFPASATASLTDTTTLIYDVQFTDSAGRVDTVDDGTVEIELDVTVTTP